MMGEFYMSNCFVDKFRFRTRLKIKNKNKKHKRENLEGKNPFVENQTISGVLLLTIIFEFEGKKLHWKKKKI